MRASLQPRWSIEMLRIPLGGVAPNLIRDPKFAPIVKDMNARLFEVLESTGGMSMPLYPDRGGQSRLRHPGRSKAADFPRDFTSLLEACKAQVIT